MYIVYANVSVDALLIPVANNYFNNKYFWNWNDDAADIIFTIE